MVTAVIAIMILALILGLAMGLSALLGGPVRTNLPTGIFTAVLILFVFACVNLLAFGSVVVIAAAVAGAIIFTVAHTRSGTLKGAVQEVTHPAIVGYVVVALVFRFVTHGLQFFNWDEFSHWGRIVKVMADTDAMGPYSHAPLMFASYPPGVSLWQYFVANVGVFSEDSAFWANHLLMLALPIPFLGFLSWRRLGTMLATWVTIVLLPTILFRDAYISLFVDCAMGLLFGYCITVAVTGGTYRRRFWWHLVPALATLVLAKGSGTFLALIVVALVVTRGSRLPRRRAFNAWAWRRGSLAIGVGTILAVTQAWKLVLEVNRTHVLWSAPIDWLELVRALTRHGEPYHSAVVSAFLTGLANKPLSSTPIGLAFWPWLGLTIAALYAICARLCRNRIPLHPAPALGVIVGGALVYAAGLLVTYLFKFSEYEAVRVASLERYLATYFVGTLTFACLLTFWGMSRLAARNRRVATVAAPGLRGAVVALLAVALTFGATDQVSLLAYREPVSTSTVVRQPLTQFSDLARYLGVEDGDKLWIMAQHTKGLEYWVLTYEFPRSAAQGWSVGAKANDEDVWTRELSPTQWRQELLASDYLLIYQVEPGVLERYSAFFDAPANVTSGSVYRVNKDGRAPLLTRVVQP